MSSSGAIAKKLLQINAIKLSPQKPFTWASGLRSPIYCDNRIALSYPEVRSFIIDQFVKKAQHISGFNLVAGVATAGIPHGALLADRLGLPFVYVRSKAKAHGRQNQIEGFIPPNSKALVIEDLISTGGSCLKATEALVAAGCPISSVLAIFTYGFDQATAAFSAAGIPFDTLCHYRDLLEVALETEYIDKNQLETLKKWRKDPKLWSESFSG